MEFSALNIPAGLVILLLLIFIVSQFLVQRKRKYLIASDLYRINTTASRAIEDIDLAMKPGIHEDTRWQRINAAKYAINSIREICQHRIQRLTGHAPQRSDEKETGSTNPE